MTRFVCCFLSLVLTVPVPMGTASAQAPSVLLAEGIQAYNDLEFPLAADLLRQALTTEGSEALPVSDRERAWMYLGAAAVLRSERSEADTAFHTILLTNPRYRPDELTFPPRVTGVFDQVREVTKAIEIVVPSRRRFTAGSGSFRAQVYATSPHRIASSVLDRRGRTVRTIYRGTVSDSMTLSWNGLRADGSSPSSGRYMLDVVSLSTEGQILRRVRVRLDVEATPLDTLSVPTPPPDSLLLPERRSATSGLKFLAPAVALGSIIALPALLGDAENEGVRIGLGVAITAGGVVAFFSQKPGKPIPENVAANERLRADWQRQAAQAQRENARRRGTVRLVIRTGNPQRIEEGAE